MHQHLFILTKSQDFRLANSALQYSLPYLHELFTLENAIDVGNTRHMRNDTSPSLTRYSGSQEQVKFMQLYLRQRSYFFLRLQKSDILEIFMIFKHKIMDLRFKSTFNLLL